MVAVITACSIVVTVTVGIRFYVRFGMIKNPGVDDWALAAVLVFHALLFSATYTKCMFQVTTVFSATLLAVGKYLIITLASLPHDSNRPCSYQIWIRQPRLLSFPVGTFHKS